MKAGRLICMVGGHKWHRFRREGLNMRECKRCGYLAASLRRVSGCVTPPPADSSSICLASP